ncbi:MAG: SusC/RagA family TonB-linked outer membrane protein [Chitinophagaceae bacterium]|nr:MAG: SusC/RagA family TonB-linked outer membrane protein [Chitinophagaceae bacterium]
MVKKVQLLVLVFLLGVMVSSAQQRAIKGKVTDAGSGKPLAGATIAVKGKSQAVTTNVNGDFEINVNASEFLEVSNVGYRGDLVAVGKSSTLFDIQLVADVTDLSEIVVTGALGVKRAAREIGASAQLVDNRNLNQGKTVNPIFGLSSKVSGLRINMYDSKVDPQVNITLRGSRSLSRTAGIDGRNPNAPIYVVDGVPVPDIARLNPNDIESITVLKGANAAALYGSEGVNGALMISTKSGKKGKGVVTFGHTTTFSNVFLLPPAQTKYGQGNNGVYDAVQYESWGPEFDGSTRDFGLPLPDGTQPTVLYAVPSKDNRLDLFNTGLTIQNDLSFSGGDDRSTYFMSVQHVDIRGIIPDDVNKRTNLRFNGSRKFGKLNASYNVNYSINDKNTTPDGPWIGAYRYPANFNFDMVKDWENTLSPGNPLNYFTSQGSWLRNPYFLIDNIRDESKQQTLNGKIELDYSFAPWFKALYRAGMYSLTDESRSSTRKFEAPGTRNTVGSVSDGSNAYRRFNSDLILNFEKQFDKISTRLLVGQNVRTDYRKTSSIGAANLLYQDLLNPGSRQGELNGSVAITEQRSSAVYGEFVAGYDNFLFLTLTGRNDWTSVLSQENRSYFYPGVSVSFVASDAITSLKDSRRISYLKWFGSWNKTGNVTLAPYQLQNAYTQSLGFPFGNLVGFLPGLVNPNPNIEPEFVTSVETGFQLGLFNNRLNIEGTYVYSDSKGQIFNATASAATGYNSARVNAGRLTNSIIEAGINGDLIRTRDIRWNLGFNFTYIDNQVKELYGGLDNINNFRQSYAVIGQQFPTLLVSDYKRDPNGNVVVDASTGDPVVATENTTLGSLVPPYQMGINTQFSFKGLTVGAQFDWRMGGWLYSEIVPAMYAAGTDPRTAAFDRQPFVWPGSVIETGPGQYQANTMLTSSGGRAFWSRQGEVQINTAAPSDFLKLRELNISYALPQSILGGQRIVRDLSIGLVGTNLFIIRHKDNKYGDPEYLYNNTDGYLSFRQVPPYRSFGFNLTASF